ncbi:hypothetical protein MalM25_06900 [Planctomycetes bacterium MalM25]|nr:hypothetical protein MalM25_06900 [Planctomycetes bacterium MalM25]
MALESIYLYSAIGGGVLLLSQFAMMLLGGDDGGLGDGMDVDAGGLDAEGIDADGSTDQSGFWFFEMLSLRTLAAAATFFGLIGGLLDSMDQPPGVSIGLGCVAGYGAMYAVYRAFKELFKLETSGNADIHNAVGKPAEVYVPIAARNERAGKVHLYLQGRTAEYQAVTDHDSSLATGAKVTVSEVVSSDTVRVTPAGQNS